MKKAITIGIIMILLLATLLTGCGEEEGTVEAKPVDVEIDNDSTVYEVDTETNTTTVMNDTEEVEEEPEEVELEEEPVAEVAEEDEIEIVDSEPEVVHGINITKQDTQYGVYGNVTKIDETSIFEITDFKISTAAEDAGYRANVAKDDEISFKFTNKDTRDYYITYMEPKDSDIMYGLKVTVNGHRIDDIEDKCGSKFIEAGQTLTCKKIPAVLKVGLDIRFLPYVNTLMAQGNFLTSKFLFKIQED